MKILLANILGLMAVILGFWGLSSLILWFTILNPDTYKIPLAESGIYNQFEEVFKERSVESASNLSDEAISSLVDLIIKGNEDENNKLNLVKISVSQTLQELLTKQTNIFLDSVFNKIDVEQRVQAVAEKAIDEGILFIKGQGNLPRVFKYIPSEELIAYAEKEGIVKVASIYAFAEITGWTSLPECENKDQISENLYFIDSKEYKKVYCTSDELRPVMLITAQNVLPEGLNNKIQATIGALVAQYNLEPIIQSVFDLFKGLDELKTVLVNLKDFAGLIKTVAIVSIVLSLILAFSCLYVFKENKFKNFIVIYLIVGVLLILFSAVNLVFINDYLMSKASFEDMIIFPKASETRNALFVNSLEDAMSGILTAIYTPLLKVGIGISVVLGIIFAGILVFNDKKRRKEFEDLLKNVKNKIEDIGSKSVK